MPKSLPPDQRARVVAHPATRVVGALYAGLYVLVVNVWVSPLNQPLVRQALSLAIDRNAIVNTLWRGRGVVARKCAMAALSRNSGR